MNEPQSARNRASDLKILIRTLSTIAICGYIAVAAAELVANRTEAADDGRSIGRSILLDPWDAKLRDDLGQYYAFIERKPEMAIGSYEAAVKMNPHVADYWLDLANAYFSTSATPQEREALRRAFAADPNSPGIARQVANAYLMAGDTPAALQMYKKVLATGSWDIESTLQICWQGTHDLNAMSEVLPANPEVHLAFLKILTDEGRVQEAEQMWPKLIGLQKRFDPVSAAPYLEYLIQANEIESARSAWRDLALVDSNFRQYTTSEDSLVVNGGFEQKVTNTGFDWRFGNAPHAVLTVDSEHAHSGTRSLSITFDGEAASDTGLLQLIPVEANSTYTFAAFARDDELFTARGPRFVISDVHSDAPLLRGEELLGTVDWTEFSGTFKTSAMTKLIAIRISRGPATERISGKLWVDDVSVRRQ